MNQLITLFGTMTLSCAPIARAQGFANPPSSSQGFISSAQLYQIRAARAEGSISYEASKSCHDTGACVKGVETKIQAYYLTPLARGLLSLSLKTEYGRDISHNPSSEYADIRSMNATSDISLRFGPHVSAGVGAEYLSQDFDGRFGRTKKNAYKGSVQPKFGFSFHTSMIELNVGEKLGSSDGPAELSIAGERTLGLQMRLLANLSVGVNYQSIFYGDFAGRKDESGSTLHLTTSIEGIGTEFFSERNWTVNGQPGPTLTSYGTVLSFSIDRLLLFTVGFKSTSSKDDDQKHSSQTATLGLIKGI